MKYFKFVRVITVDVPDEYGEEEAWEALIETLDNDYEEVQDTWELVREEKAEK